MANILTVTELNLFTASLLEEDENLQFVMVQGEVTNFKRYPSGHCYFSLKDSESVLKCVMFKGFADRCQFKPENGSAVVAGGSVEIYVKNGEYHLKVINILPYGEADLQAKQDALSEKLRSLGMFDRKRPLPEYPQKIGVVTSVAGAVIHDIVNVLKRRYPLGAVSLYPAQVQGDGAETSIAEGISLACKDGCDVLIVGRGGGSKEDLGAFDTEKVAFAIFNSAVPVISAVGHETDFTIADYVSDLRAPTPSAAAELVAPSIDSIKMKLAHFEAKIGNFSPKNSLEKLTLKVETCESKIKELLEQKFAKTDRQLTELDMRIEIAINRKYESSENKFINTVTKLEALNPLSVLTRGYSIVYDNKGKVISSATSVKSGDKLKIRFNDSEVSAVAVNEQ